MVRYEAQILAVREKMARLRALRLARVAAEWSPTRPQASAIAAVSERSAVQRGSEADG